MEIIIDSPGESKEESKNSGQLSKANGILGLCESKILPLFQKFLKDNISWSKMITEEYNESEVIELFRKEVIPTANSFILEQKQGKKESCK